MKHISQKYLIRFRLGSPSKSKIKNWGSQKTWPDRAKLSIQFFIFHQTLLNPHSETNSIFHKFQFVGPCYFAPPSIRWNTITSLEVLQFLTSQILYMMKSKISQIAKTPTMYKLQNNWFTTVCLINWPSNFSISL